MKTAVYLEGNQERKKKLFISTSAGIFMQGMLNETKEVPLAIKMEVETESEELTERMDPVIVLEEQMADNKVFLAITRDGK